MWATGAGDVGTIWLVFSGNHQQQLKAFSLYRKVLLLLSQWSISSKVFQRQSNLVGLGIAAGLKVAAEGASIISTIKGTNIQVKLMMGGILYQVLVHTILKKGERVVGKSLNQDLTKYLK